MKGGEGAASMAKGETIEHPGRFFNQIITVIRCKANVKRINEIPMREEQYREFKIAGRSLVPLVWEPI